MKKKSFGLLVRQKKQLNQRPDLLIKKIIVAALKGELQSKIIFVAYGMLISKLASDIKVALF